MRTFTTVLLVVSSLAIAAQVGAATATHPTTVTTKPAMSADQAALVALDATFTAAVQRNDPVAVADVYAEDAIVMDPGPAMMIKGRAAIRESWKGFFAAMAEVNFKVHDLNYKVSGDIGYASGLWDLTAKDRATGAAIQMAGRVTSVYEKRDGKWLIVLDHASIPVPASDSAHDH